MLDTQAQRRWEGPGKWAREYDYNSTGTANKGRTPEPAAIPISGSQMSAPTGAVFQSRVDDFSCQVYTSSDTRFWFRLVRERDQDIITDFFIGSFSREQSGLVLAECYRVLNLTPKMTIVFRDILSGKEVNPTLLTEAEDLYTRAGKSLLTEFGAKNVDCYTEQSRGKFNLVLAGRIL
jgi:hypothetical protein